MAEPSIPHYPGDIQRDEESLEEHRTELSEERTQMALQRTLWAAEQTLNAWLRTALACAVAAMATFEFVRSAVTWVAPAIGTTLAATSVGLYGFALWRHAEETRRLRAAGVIVTPLWLVGVLVAPMAAAAALTLLLILR